MSANVSKLPQKIKLASPLPGLCYPAMETMGDRIKRLREAKGWRQDELADRLMLHLKGTDLTVSREAVSQWERGETKNIKNVIFYWLVVELGTTSEYLLFGPDRASSGTDRIGRKRQSS